ncbi:dopamine beta-hydroxylase-like isoform X1 [Styela clava]
MLTLIFIVLTTLGLAESDNSKYEVVLFHEDNLTCRLFWDVDYSQKSIDITIQLSGRVLSADSSTLIGFGISDRGGVNNADILLMEYSQEEVAIKDGWSDDAGFIHYDDIQNYFLKTYEVASNLITIEFWRYFDTLEDHDYKLENGTTNLIYLLSRGGEENHSSSEAFPYNVQRTTTEKELNVYNLKSGFIRVQLLKPEIPESYFRNKNDGKIMSMTMLQPNISLPSSVTTYWSSIHKLPESIVGKIHVIGFGPAISSNSTGLIHHMLMYLCDPNDGEISPYSGFSASSNVPDDVRRCKRVIGGWAMGATTTWYPKEVGLPLGLSYQSRYLRLEVHYNNPFRRSGVVDNSGIRFFYTNHPRKYDSGVLEVGVTNSKTILGIPPQRDQFVLSGTCTKQCTLQGLLPDGINIFASHLHAHLASRKIWVTHLRNGANLPEINRDDHYSTFFEEIRPIYPPMKVMPGDSLTTHCSYDTSNREKVTFTGPALTDEMCLTFLHYYPLAPLELCTSATSASSLTEFFVLEKLLKNRPQHIDLEDVSPNYKNMRWDDETSKELDAWYKSAAQDIKCQHHDGSSFQDVTVL